MTTPLLATKFYIPPPAPDQLARPRLLRRLDETLQPGGRLALVCAPAGYGKTTLLSGWLATLGSSVRIAWLSLEPADNDPGRFFAYLAAALDKHTPGAAALMEGLLSAPRMPAPADLAAALINPLAEVDGTLILVLDDLQAISDPGLHAALASLVDHLPPQVRLALSTRSNPPLPLHRLRARGQLVELRLNDLRFELEETRQFLQRAGEHGLDGRQIDLLEERTEGWAAGLRMALLSMRGRPDLDAFLQSLSGSQHYILDYLTGEALNNQNPELHDFLLQTALLERLCAPLCDALTLRQDGQAALEALERANCFLIPLDEERKWYRYHHLFADLLRVRLRQRDAIEPGLIQALHRRAAGWLERNEYNEEAISHAILAADYEQAAQIVERSTLDLLAHGRLHQLLHWVRLLPEQLADQRPLLALAQAWALAFAARLPEAALLLDRVEAALPAAALDPAAETRLRGEMRAVRSLIAVTDGKLADALALTVQPQDAVPVEAPFARSVQRWAVGYALRMIGDLHGAEVCFSEVQQIGFDLDNLWTINTGSVDLGAVLRQQGELRRAEAVYRAGLGRSRQAAGGPGYVGRLESFLANLLIDRDELEEAGQLLDAALRHNRNWENPNHCAYAWLITANLALAQNRPGDAAAALDQAQTWITKGPVVPTLPAALQSAQARLWVLRGDRTSAEKWLAAQQFTSPPPGRPMSEMEDALRLTAARLRLAAGQLEAARDLLAPLEEFARRGGKLTTLIETRVLQALAAPAPPQGVAALREALELGLPRGYRRVFLNEGQALLPLLETCLDLKVAGDLPGVSTLSGAGDLLAALRGAEKNTPSSPLSARELEILRWMAAGLSNPQIGDKLFLAAGTVKAHTAAIYRKLDAANRAEAIAKAKDLGLL